MPPAHASRASYPPVPKASVGFGLATTRTRSRTRASTKPTGDKLSFGEKRPGHAYQWRDKQLAAYSASIIPPNAALLPGWCGVVRSSRRGGAPGITQP